MTSPGEDPICFDVDTESENILALFADGSSALEINAQFKVRLTAGHISTIRVTNGLILEILLLFQNVNGGLKQFMKVIGFTSPDGVQIMMTDKSLEVYDKGVVRSTFNITSETGKLNF